MATSSSFQRVFTDLSVDSLFIVGLHIEILAALFLIAGSFGSTRSIWEVAQSRWGWSGPLLANLIQEKVRSLFGFAGLFLGFLLQILGYYATLYGSGRESKGAATAEASLLVALLCCLLYLIFYLLLRKVIARSQAFKVAMLSDRDPTEKKQILASISAELGYSLKQPEGEPSEAELDFFLQKLYGKRRITLLEKSQGAQME